MSQLREVWSSRLGVILAVAGSAVGLGNFLRFPGLAAQYGGGSFMIAYFVALLLIGIPIGWTEWTLGRYGGRNGFHSAPGIFFQLVRHPLGKYLGLLGVIVPVGVYMYYVNIEAWCLGYALHFLTGSLNLGSAPEAYTEHFAQFTGLGADGLTLRFSLDRVDIFLIAVFILNFVIIYRGISRGIELVCKIAMPLLVVIALILLVRVLTLGAPLPDRPDQTVWNGLGFLWNPDELISGLANPQLWLAAAGQIFFSLSVGFGVIITYASYLSPKDDVVLSGLTAASANEFCEVALGGLITVPAAYAFLGATAMAGVVASGSFNLGFNVLPLVFSSMPMGQLFGFLFFLLLFLAAVTSSLSMLQPGIAFLEEGLGLNRNQSVTFLGMITAMGAFLVLYFSKDLKALDTIDFWIGTLGIFVQGTLLIIIFGWVMGVEKGWKEAHLGAAMRIPSIYRPIIKYVTPAFLLTIFVLFIMRNVFGWNFSLIRPVFEPTGYIVDLIGSPTTDPNPVAIMTVLFICVIAVFLIMLIGQSGQRWQRRRDTETIQEHAPGETRTTP